MNGRRRRLAGLLACLVTVAGGSAGGPSGPTESWFDNFSVPGPVYATYQPPWSDIPVSIGRYFNEDEEAGPRQSLLLREFTEGTIHVDTGIEERIKHPEIPDPFAGTGLVIKEVGEERVVLRLGAYNWIQLQGTVGGQPCEMDPVPFILEPGKTYHVKAELQGGRCRVWVDDRLYIDEACPISTDPGRTGFHCESPAWYDNYSVTGLLPDPMALSGSPDLDTVYARFRPDRPWPGESFSVHGAIDIFLRNTGDGPAQLESVTLNGAAVDLNSQNEAVAWYEQRPWRIRPGETGHLLLRMRGLPAAMGDQLLATPDTPPCFEIVAHWKGGATRAFSIPFRTEMDPFQINFLSFNKDLRTIHVYLQNNDWIARGRQTAKPLGRIDVGGQDVTVRAVPGEPTLRAGVVPVRVDLEQPLEERRHVTVLVQTADGTWTGHSLRVFPSRTILQVSVFAQWLGDRYSLGPRADWMEDIFNHGATAIGVVGKKYDHLAGMREMGLLSAGLGSMVSGLAAWATPWEHPDHPPVAAMWMDEVDKRSLGWNFNRWQAMKTRLRTQGRKPPLHITNVMLPHSAEGPSFMEFPDAVMQAHGFGQGSGGLEQGFGRAEAIPWRQFRMSRRPFYPYFRNAEIYPQIDRETMTTPDLRENERGFYRCMTGDEQRWMYYGALLQGAKGVFHWGYSGIRDYAGYAGDSLRLGLGGAGTGRAWNITIRPEQVDMLQNTWHAIGECNAEWRAIAPLIAISDIDTRSRIVRCDPPVLENGDVPVATSTLVCGLEALVVVSVNHPTVRRGLSSLEPCTFDPSRVVLEVRLPPWLTDATNLFSVAHQGIADARPSRREGDTLRFDRTVNVSDLIVIARDPAIRSRCEATLAEMQDLLQRARATVPVHTGDPSPHTDWIARTEESKP